MISGKCQHCENDKVHSTYESQILILPQLKNKNTYNLEEEFVPLGRDLLKGYTCENCFKFSNETKRNVKYVFNNFLVIQLNVVNFFQNNKYCFKNTYMNDIKYSNIHFPETLVIGENKSFKIKCIIVYEPFSNNINSGHYYCIRKINNLFFKINESNISMIDLPKRIENPYLIFLEKEN